MNLSRLLIQGHRGYGRFEPHNTLKSFKRCIDEQLDIIELDVWLTKDNKLIVYHDEGRYDHGDITIGGQKMYIEQLSADYIIHNYIINNEQPLIKIPTLDETLNLCFNNIRLNIELKGMVCSGLIGAVLDMVYNKKMQDQVILSSFRHSYYKLMEQYYKEKQIQRKMIPFHFLYCYDEETGNNEYEKWDCVDLRSVPGFPNGISFPAYFIQRQRQKQRMYEAKQLGFDLSAYFNINEQENYEIYDQLVLANVDSIITNEPDFLKQYIKK